MPGARILTDMQIEKMATLREKGWSYQRIANYFTFNEATPIHAKSIRWQCLRVGAVPPGPPHPNLGCKVFKSRGRAFTEAEDAIILYERKRGSRISEIARALGRPQNSIIGRLMTLAYHDELAA